MITIPYRIVISNYDVNNDEFYAWVHKHGGFVSESSAFGFTTVYLESEQDYLMYLLRWA